jgi:hypothetical protein
MRGFYCELNRYLVGYENSIDLEKPRCIRPALMKTPETETFETSLHMLIMNASRKAENVYFRRCIRSELLKKILSKCRIYESSQKPMTLDDSIAAMQPIKY